MIDPSNLSRAEVLDISAGQLPYLWSAQQDNPEALRQIVAAIADHPPGPARQLTQAHPASGCLAQILTHLHDIHGVTSERELSATERIEVIENLAHVCEWTESLTHRGWRRDGSLILNHHTLQAPQHALAAPERHLSMLAKELLAEHGEYEVDDDSFPRLEPLMRLLEEASGHVDDAGYMTDPQAIEVSTWLLELTRAAVGILVNVARRSQPDDQTCWQAATETSQAVVALLESAHYTNSVPTPKGSDHRETRPDGDPRDDDRSVQPTQRDTSTRLTERGAQ